MDKFGLQTLLQRGGFYHGKIDGIFGEMSRTALNAAFTSGPDTPLQRSDVALAAKLNNLSVALVDTVYVTEANGRAFDPTTGKPLVLFEGHWFSRLTNHKYDAGYPDISYPKWDRTKYPAGQAARWSQILRAVSLDVDAGLSSASYGAFQIMGGNYAACGFDNPYSFVWAMTQSVGAQLQAFMSFTNNTYHKGKTLIEWLRLKNWAMFAEGYNGTAYRQNHYDTNLAGNYARRPDTDK